MNECIVNTCRNKGICRKRCKSMRFANALRIDSFPAKILAFKKRVKQRGRKCEQYLNPHRSLYCNCAIRQWRCAGQQSSRICLTSNEWYAPLSSISTLCIPSAYKISNGDAVKTSFATPPSFFWGGMLIPNSAYSRKLRTILF